MGGEFRLVVDGGQGIDADHGMDGRHGQGDVAHVGGTCGAGFPFAEIGEGAAEGFGILAIEVGHDDVVAHFGIGLVATGDREFGAGGEGSGFEAPVDFGAEFGELIEGFGANDVLGGSVGGDDVGSGAAVGDDAVNAVGRTDVLSEEADRGLRDGEGVGGVYAKLGEGRGVRFLAGAMNFKHGSGDDFCADHIKGGGVNHHGGVDACETAAFEEENFAAGVAYLFGGGADDADGEASLVGYLGGGQGCADGGGSDDVVAASVTDAGERVVLSANGDVKRAGADAGTERSGKIANPFFYFEAGVG